MSGGESEPIAGGFLPEAVIIEAEPDRYILEIVLEAGQPWFAGHFPEQAVLAGIVQVHWAMGFAKGFGFWEDDAPELRRVKFKAVLLPPTTVQLTLLKRAKGFRFLFESDGVLHSEGSVQTGRNRTGQPA